MATNFLTRVLCTCTLLAAFPVAVKADLAHEFGFDGNAADAKSSFVFNLAYTATASGTSTTGMFGTNCLSGLSGTGYGDSSFANDPSTIVQPNTAGVRDYTLSTWINGHNNDTALIFCWADGSNGEQIRLDDGHLTYGRHVPNWNSATGDGIVPSSGWQLITVSVQGDTINGYINKVRVIEGATVTGDIFGGANILGNYWGAGLPLGGMMDDLAIWSGALNADKVNALYNVPQVAGLTTYDSLKMNELFKVYDSTDSSASVTLGSLKWEKAAGLVGHVAGDAWTADGQHYLVQLDSAGNGVVSSVVPEPNAFVLLLSAMLGLIAYAWRKRK